MEWLKLYIVKKMAPSGINSFNFENSSLNHTYSINVLIKNKIKMTSKLPYSKYNLYSWTKSSMKRTNVVFLKLFINTIITKIKYI
jgi:hypothetical protein